MLRLLRFFRPALEWLESRCTPAAVAPAAAPVPDAVFLGDVRPLPYLSVVVEPPADLAARDAVFASLGPTQFTFLPPPPPRWLPPTPSGGHDELPVAFEWPELVPASEDVEDLDAAMLELVEAA